MSKHARTDLRHWQGKLFKQTYTREGKSHELSNYSVKLQHLGRRETFNLGTPNKAAAAARAREVYLHLRAKGWEATLAAHKPKALPAVNLDATIGDLLAELRAKADVSPKTLERYARGFRKIVADAFEIPGSTKRFDSKGGGRLAWLERVEAVKLADVTPGVVQQWKRAFLARAGTNPAKQRSSRVSANAFLRRVKNLFSPKLTRHLETVKLPSPLPFEGVQLEKQPSYRYRSTFDVFGLIEAAREELSGQEPEMFKVFLLAVMAGLRRNEIDKLEWPAFRWEQGIIRIEATEWLHPKSEESASDVEVDPELLEVFRGYRARSSGSFVIESPNLPKPGSLCDHYRCMSTFKRLTAWLRSKGVAGGTPLHALRKEFGSRICEEHGIYAASRALRHASVKITEGHYVDKRRRVTSGMGHLLKPGKVTEFPTAREQAG